VQHYVRCADKYLCGSAFLYLYYSGGQQKQNYSVVPKPSGRIHKSSVCPNKKTPNKKTQRANVTATDET
jgi:hypothetical protein